MKMDNKNKRISISECKKFLSKNGKNYTDNEIISIRDLLYCLAQIDIDIHYHNQKMEVNDKSNAPEMVISNSSLKVNKYSNKGGKGLKKAA